MREIKTIGYWSGIFAFGATVLFVIVQMLQILRVFSFPVDAILIYTTSLCIVVPFIVEMLALHYNTPVEKRFWTHGALIFTTLYAMFVTANYVVQLATVIPMQRQGRAIEVSLLEQTPHSLFWNFDALGYIFMGLAMLFAVPAFARAGFQKKVRLSFLANALVTPFIAFVYFYPTFSEKLLFVGLPWAITAPLAMVMLALLFRNEKQHK